MTGTFAGVVPIHRHRTPNGLPPRSCDREAGKYLKYDRKPRFFFPSLFFRFLVVGCHWFQVPVLSTELQGLPFLGCRGCTILRLRLRREGLLPRLRRRRRLGGTHRGRFLHLHLLVFLLQGQAPRALQVLVRRRRLPGEGPRGGERQGPERGALSTRWTRRVRK